SPRLAIRTLCNERMTVRSYKYHPLLIIDRNEKQSAGHDRRAGSDAASRLEPRHQAILIEIALTDFEQNAYDVAHHMLQKSGAGDGINQESLLASKSGRKD